LEETLSLRDELFNIEEETNISVNKNTKKKEKVSVKKPSKKKTKKLIGKKGK